VTTAPLDRISRWPADVDTPWRERSGPGWLTLGTRLLPIGSCFALNFTRWFRLHGAQAHDPGWGMHYNPPTILTELRCAAGEATPDIRWRSEDEAGHRVVVDALRHPVQARSDAALDNLRETLRLRGAAALADADAVLVTLGLSEVWQQLDAYAGWITVNRTPPASEAGLGSHRTRFLTGDEVAASVRDIIHVVRVARGAAIPIVFTVSPIPLKASFTGLDARVANTRSKAALVTGLHTVLDERPAQVHYFPAYELFWAAPREAQWQVDCRHPTAGAIERACHEFVRQFALDPQDFAAPVTFRVRQVGRAGTG
jgi:hypothetical protein